MKVEGEKEFDAPAELVWEVLNDPARMAKLLPGVEGFEVHDERNWTAAVKIPLGMGGLNIDLGGWRLLLLFLAAGGEQKREAEEHSGSSHELRLTKDSSICWRVHG